MAPALDHLQDSVDEKQPRLHETDTSANPKEPAPRVLSHVGSILFVTWGAIAGFVNWELSRPWVIIAGLVALNKAWGICSSFTGLSIGKAYVVVQAWCDANPKKVRTTQFSVVFAFCLWWVFAVLLKELWRLRPLFGLLMILGGVYVTSFDRKSVNWYPVLSGLFWQFLLAAVMFHNSYGLHIFSWLGGTTDELFRYSEAGVRFTFGADWADHYFICMFPGTMAFFAACTGALFYMGWFQVIFNIVSKVFMFLLGTSPLESFVAGCDIFLGMCETPILISPFLNHMTRSEEHAMMTCGFGTLSAVTTAAFMQFGIDPLHLLVANVISCPCGLTLAKLSYPETDAATVGLPQVAEILQVKNKESKETCVTDAMCNGALSVTALSACICAVVIAFLALWSFANSVVQFAFEMIGIQGLTVEVIFGWLHWPLAYMIGVPSHECLTVGKLIAKRTIVNEFVAYYDLSVIIKNGELSERGAIIATYALNGFANLSSIAIQTGCLSSLAPERQDHYVSLNTRAWMNGSMMCLAKACIAAMMFEPSASVLAAGTSQL